MCPLTRFEITSADFARYLTVSDSNPRSSTQLVDTIMRPQLRSWSAEGTLTRTMHVSPDDARQAAKNFGMSASGSSREQSMATKDCLSSYIATGPRLLATLKPKIAPQQTKQSARLASTSNGLVTASPWGTALPLTRRCRSRSRGPTGIKISAANEEDVKAQLDRLAPDLALPREQIDVERPSGWPVLAGQRDGQRRGRTAGLPPFRWVVSGVRCSSRRPG
jgi:hypothetical protein